MKTIHLAYILILTLLFAACKKPGCFEHAGAMTTTTRSLSGFRSLTLNDNINVVLIQDTTNSLIIEAPENIQPNITADVTDSVLTISNATECRWLRNAGEKITALLHFRELSLISYNGSGNISNIDTLKLDRLQIETTTGAGNIELTIHNRYIGSYIFQENAEVILHGNAEICYTYTNARGKIDFTDFTTKAIVIEYGGLADTHINVTENLDAIIYYKGNLIYSGNPVVSRSEYFSSGRLIHAP